jgi:hypothetical protein
VILEPHALVRGEVPGVCVTCKQVYVAVGIDPVHGSTPGTCELCKAQTPPMRTVCDACTQANRDAREAALAARLAEYAETGPAPVKLGDDWDDEPRRGAREVDNSPEAVEARRIAKGRHGEAVAYVASYTGSWGLPRDIRSGPKWGTKYLRLTTGQVDALLKGKARDEERAQAQAAALADPRQQAAREFLTAIQSPHPGFEDDMVAHARLGRPFTDNQLAAIERWRDRVSPAAPAGATAASPQAHGLAPQPSPGAPVAEVAEGMYRDPDGAIFKAQRTRQHDRLYAKRLVVRPDGGTFEFESGLIRRIRPEWRMTVEEAAQFGKLYGWCCVCGAKLTDEKSIAAGIGPVCASRV